MGIADWFTGLWGGGPPSALDPQIPVDPYGRQESQDEAPSTDRITNTRIEDRYAELAGARTAKQITQILRAASAGDLHDQVILAREMESRDPVIASGCQTRKLAVSGCEWEVTPVVAAEDSRQQLAEEIATAARQQIESIHDWPGTELDMMDAVLPGVTVFEIDYRPGGEIIQLRAVDQKRLSLGPGTTDLFIAGEDGDPYAYRIADYPNKFVVHQPRTRTGHAGETGLVRVLAQPYLIRRYAQKDWLIRSEVFGVPARLGILENGATGADQATLERALKKMGSDFWAVISSRARIEFVEAPNGEGPHKSMLEWAAAEIDYCILGMERQRNSNTVGQYHYSAAIRQDLLEADCRGIGHTVREQILRPWVGYNYGWENVDLTPYYSKRYEQPKDLKTLAEVYKTLVSPVEHGGMGLSIRRDHVYDVFGLPEPEEGTSPEDLLFPPNPPEPPPASRTPARAPENDDDDPDDAEKSFDASKGSGSADPLDTLAERAHRAARPIFAEASARVVEIVKSSKSFDEAEQRIIRLYRKLPKRDLERLVMQAASVARLHGYATAADDAGKKKL